MNQFIEKRMPAVAKRYKSDPLFRRAVDDLWRSLRAGLSQQDAMDVARAAIWCSYPLYMNDFERACRGDGPQFWNTKPAGAGETDV